MSASFEHASLRDLTERTQLWNPERDQRDSIRYIDVSAVSREDLSIHAVTELRASAAPSRARKVVRAKDTVFATVRPGLRRIAQVPEALDDSIASTAFCVLRPKLERIDPDFLFFAVSADSFVREVASFETGASYPAVRDSDVLDQQVPVPSLHEQTQIATVLTAIRKALRHNASSHAHASALKRAAMRELFTRGLRGGPQQETEFGLVPGDWRVLPLEGIAAVQTGVAKGRKFINAEMVEVPYLRVANVQDGHLDFAEIKSIQIRRSEVERYRLRSGDVVLTEGGDFDKLGRGFIWRGELELCVHQNHIFAVRPDSSQLLPEFFAYLAQSAYGKAYFLQVAHKTTNLACINSTKLKAFPVVFPTDVDEQREIVDILDAIDKKLNLHNRKRAVLEDLFKTLLHKLMSGEIRVSDLNLSALQTVTANGAKP